ncbi:MAG: hypothetical protein HXX17_15720 [Geobacteraceae bacterium]|nr:hypothetical protein [Geobacteraceae bacterium]
MSDKIFLEFSNDAKTWKKVEHFISYTVEADLYVADHAFSLELANPEIDIHPGSQCRLYVNDQLELTGIVDRRARRCDKQGKKLTIEGRDLMGLLVDSYCEQFITVQNTKLSALAELLLKTVPFINRKDIIYQQDLVGKLKTRKRRGTSDFMAFFDAPQKMAMIAPGMTIFQVLQTYALSRGQMFYGLPDGTFVFGRPLVGGEPEYSLIINKEGIGNNLISADVEENISKRFSKVTVIGQQQGDDLMDMDATKVQTKATVADPGFPFYKPFVQCNNNDSQSPALHARLLMTRMQHEGFRLTYELARHSQNGRNFSLNRMAQVKDSIHDVDGAFLITGRTFKLDKQSGASTLLRLSPPGLVEDSGLQKGARK